MSQLRRRARGSGLALAVGSLLVVVGAAPASAHASLVSSNPADRSSVATAPRTVSLTFDENLRMPSVILVRDADGASIVQGKASVLDNTVSTRVRAEGPGDYTVVYRVVSVDGHPVSGRLSFGVGPGHSGGAKPASGEAAAADHGHESSSPGAGAGVIGMIAGLALAAGVGLLTVRRWAPNLWSGS